MSCDDVAYAAIDLAETGMKVTISGANAAAFDVARTRWALTEIQHPVTGESGARVDAQNDQGSHR